MAKKAATFRLEETSLEWVADYARKREVSQAAVMELAIAALRGDAQGGVPDIEPEEAESTPSPKPTPVKAQVRPGVVVRASSLLADPPSLALERQRRLNESAARARKGGKP